MAGNIWATGSLGGFFHAENLSDELRMSLQPELRFTQFADIQDASQQGLHKGSTFHWDVVLDVADASGTLVETNTMPESNLTIVQGTLTLNEYGISVPYSKKLEALSQFSVRQPIMKQLKNDARKTYDAAVKDQFNESLLRVVPTGGTSTNAVTLTTNGTATLTNNIAFNNDHAKAIVDIMSERNITPYKNGDYMAIAWPTTYRTFKNNLETIHQYTETGLGMIFKGEVGRYEGVRFVEQTNVKKGGAANSTTYNSRTTADAWDNAASDWIYFFGEETVAQAINTPMEIRAKIPTDYGRSQGVAWYSIEGFGIVHTIASEQRIVVWDSAA